MRGVAQACREGVDLGDERGGAGGLLAGEVPLLARVAIEPEELGARSAEQLLARAAPRPDRAPVVEEPALVGHAQHPPLLGELAEQRAALQPAVRLETDGLQHGGRDVGQRGRGRDQATRLDPGPAQQERDAQHLVVEVEAVRREAVGTEVLAVVGGDDEQRVVEPAAPLERVDETADLGVGEGDLAEVGGVAEALGSIRCRNRKTRSASERSDSHARAASVATSARASAMPRPLVTPGAVANRSSR